MSKPYYQDDLVTLYHGDCREVTQWLEADVLVTDPPYGVDYRGRDGVAIANDKDFLVAKEVLDLWGASKPWAAFAVSKNLADTITLAPRFRLLTWHKSNVNGGVGTGSPWLTDVEFAVCAIPGAWPKHHASALVSAKRFTGNPDWNADPDAYLHPTQKPLRVMEHVISAMPVGVVADPFSGSGSTLAAAKLLGRRAVGVELDESYCEKAAQRLTQDTLFGEAS